MNLQSEVAAMTPPPSSMTDGSDATKTYELISFRVGDEEYCFDVMQIREIRSWTQATPLPAAPHFVQGVINLRGTVLPVIDLAAKLGLPTSEPTPRHAVIVTEVNRQLVGVLVEGVSEIFRFEARKIQPIPPIADNCENYLRGVIPMEGRLIGFIGLNLLIPDNISASGEVF